MKKRVAAVVLKKLEKTLATQQEYTRFITIHDCTENTIDVFEHWT